MSVIAGLAKSEGTRVFTGTRPARKPLHRSKRTLLVIVLTLVAVVAFATLISTSQAPTAKYYSVGSKVSQSGTAAVPVSEPGAAPQMSEKEAIDAYGKLPLSFIPNEGQTDKAVRYYAQGAGFSFFFTHKGATLSFTEGKGHGVQALALDFLGAKPHATLTARKQNSGEVNYLIGNDPAKWQQGLPTHGELLYGGLWPGIDMAVRGEGGKLKYEFHLKPGSSVDDVRLGYRGAEGLSVGAGGQLLVRTSLGVLKDAAPVSYQRIRGERVPVESRYKLLKGERGYGFAVGAYDPHYPLVIDPGLDYSTYLGGTGSDAGLDIAVREGNAYVTGFTTSTDYPTTASAYDTSLDGGGDAFVTKLNAAGSELVYSTFLGGTNQDGGRGIAVDGSGSAYVTGGASADYPTTPGAFETTFNGGDAFVTKLNAAGSELVYSTFLGGTSFDDGSDIAVDGSGSAYVTGQTQSADYPTTSGAFDISFNGGFNDAFVTKLNASGSALDYSTFLGGTGGMRKRDESRGIAVDGSGSAYVTGLTQSADYPTSPGAFDISFIGGPTGANFDAFATKLNASGSKLAYSTFLGGTTEDIGNGIAVDGSGSAYVTGYTRSADYPTSPGAFDTSKTRDDAFVTKLNASGSKLAYSTFLGGTSVDQGLAIAVREGRAYVTGATSSANYPTTRGAFDRTFNVVQDAFVTKLNASGSALAYSTFLAGTSSDGGWGIAVDGSGSAYVTGQTQSAEFPTTPGAFDRTFHGTLNGSEDAFVTKLPTG